MTQRAPTESSRADTKGGATRARGFDGTKCSQASYAIDGGPLVRRRARVGAATKAWRKPNREDGWRGDLTVWGTTGNVGIGKTAASTYFSLDVSGSVNIDGTAPIFTNGIAIGTIINGTWVTPSSYTSGTTQSLYSLTISTGTWLLIGCGSFYSSSSGTCYYGIGPTAGVINQNVRSNVSFPASASGDISLNVSHIVTTSATTIYYFVGMANASTGAWSNAAYNYFKAVKIC